MTYYPIFLDIKGKRCVVVGGGTVALRKVNMLLDHGANVTVISPELCPELEQMANDVVAVVQREYQSGDLEKAFVVIAATDDPGTNEQVAKEATERGLLINVVDVPALSSFIVPSYLRRGDLTVAVSTNGKSPALARKVRSELEDVFEREYEDLLALVDEVRAEFKQKGVAISAEDWHKALDIDVLLASIRNGEVEKARAMLLQNLGGTQH